MKKSTGSFLNSYQNKAASQAPKFWSPGLCPRSGCTVPSHEYRFTASEIRGSLQGYPGLLTAWIGISWSVYCPAVYSAFFPESCCQAWPQPLEGVNDVQCVNGITQHPFAWLCSWPGWSQDCDADMNKDVLRFPRDRGSGIWRLSLGSINSHVYRMGMWGGCNQPGIIQPGCGGSTWAQILFSVCSFFFFFFSWPCHVACRILTLGPGTESGRWPVKVLSPNHPTAQEFSGLKLEEDAKGQQGGRSENRLLWGLWWRGTVEGCWPSNLTAQPCSFHPHWLGVRRWFSQPRHDHLQHAAPTMCRVPSWILLSPN